MHINDSKNPYASHKDRHQNIGFGEIGFDNLIKIIYHDKLKEIPKILETPYIKENPKDKISYPPYKEEIQMIAILPAIKKWMDKDTKIYINPTGKFVIGGPQSDTGLTGRKIIVDTYGGRCPHGGGAFSGKDPTKVDRSAAYMARYIAKNIVAAKLAHECTVQIAYAIGRDEPVGFYVDTDGTGVLPDEKLAQIAKKIFPMTPRGIIEHFKLRNPIYGETAAFGHFGRKDFPWEKLDKVDSWQKAAN